MFNTVLEQLQHTARSTWPAQLSNCKQATEAAEESLLPTGRASCTPPLQTACNVVLKIVRGNQASVAC